MFAPLAARARTKPPETSAGNRTHRAPGLMAHRHDAREPAPFASPDWNFAAIPIFPGGLMRRPEAHELRPPALQHTESPVRFQRKLTVGPPGDVFERQADSVADQVMRMPGPKLQHACACGGACPKCRQQPGVAREILRTKGAPASVSAAPAAPHSVESVVSSAGQPLDSHTRAFFEPRFGYDFSRVRIHTGAQAAESAAATQALAYTVGDHIAFAAHAYAPRTAAGRKLLAHELTHVVQQRPDRVARQTVPPTPQTVIADANTRRTGTLLFAISELSDVISTVQLGLQPNPYTFTVAAIRNWFFVSPGDPAFLPTVQAIVQLYLRNMALTPRLLYQSNTVQVDPFGNACPGNFAYSRGFSPIFFCDDFIAAGIGCQRDVAIHEHFHLLGLVDLPAVATTAQALTNPDSLAQLAAEIADGPHTPCCLGTC